MGYGNRLIGYGKRLLRWGWRWLGTLGVSVFFGKGESIGALGLSGTFR